MSLAQQLCMFRIGIASPMTNLMISLITSLVVSLLAGQSAAWALTSQTSVRCNLVGANLALGFMDPLQQRYQDGTGEIHLVCQNLSDQIVELSIAIEFGSEPSGGFSLNDRPPYRSSERDIPIRFYADPLRTQELALGGGGRSVILRSLTVFPRVDAELRIPIYARADLTRLTSAGSYQKIIPLVVSY